MTFPVRRTIDFEKLSIETVKENYSDLLFTFQQCFGMSEKEASLAVSITVGVCPYCWENKRGCQCWNDE